MSKIEFYPYIYCPHCKTQVSNGYGFRCPICGNKLKDDEKLPKKTFLQVIKDIIFVHH